MKLAHKKANFVQKITVPLADLGGVKGTHAPSGPNFLHFHAVFGENWPNNRLAPPPGFAPPGEILDPPLSALTKIADEMKSKLNFRT